MYNASAKSVEPQIEVVPVLTWTVFRLINEMRRDAIIQAINEYFPRMETADVIWDLSAASLAALSEGDIDAILDAARAHAPKRRDARTVFVCSNPAVFDAINVYIKSAQQAGMTVDYAVVATLVDAERWVTCNRKHRCGSGTQEPGSPDCKRSACRSLWLLQSYRRFRDRSQAAPQVCAG